MAKKQVLTIPGTELKPDRFENGIQYLKKSDQPFNLIIEIDNYEQNKQILINLIDQIEDEPEIIETDEVMNELERIISGTQYAESQEDDEDDTVDDDFEQNDESEEDDDYDDFNNEEDDEDEEDLDDHIVQQTLF